MKATKKIAAIMLALMLALSMTVTAFAEGTTGSITVDNPKNGETYTAYKIFDLDSYNTADTAYAYTIKSDSEWFLTVQEYNGITLTQVNGGTTYNVKENDNFSAPDFANKLKAAVSGKTGTDLAVSNGVASVDNLPLGYYFVDNSTGALCNLTTTAPDATIHDKNDMPFVKTDNKVSADIGDTVNYTIKGKVPDTTGFDSYTYIINDTMSEGLTFSNDIAVKINGIKITDCTIVTKNEDKDLESDFQLSIPVMNYQSLVGKEIEVTYSAILNEKAVAKTENNSATLTYSDDPTTNTTNTTKPVNEKVYSSKVVIDKCVEGSESTKLAGAQFIMYKEMQDTDGTSKLYYKYDATNKKVEWVADKDSAEVKTTNGNGEASFDGIADGTYYLEEIKAPEGYNLLTGPKKVTVNGSASLTVTTQVPNAKGPMLPSTGGIGTTIIFIIGGALVLGAVVMLVTRKRMDKKD